MWWIEARPDDSCELLRRMLPGFRAQPGQLTDVSATH